MDSYLLAPGLRICFDEIHTNSWTKGDSSQFSGQMLILNFCIQGRCDVSLAQNRYAIVKEGQLCASTIWPTKDFYYPGRLYEGIQIYVGLNRAEERQIFCRLWESVRRDLRKNSAETMEFICIG